MPLGSQRSPLHWRYISVRERTTRPMPRMTRVISSELIIARSGHTTHNAQRARHGGEYCDDYFEQGCPVELVHRGC